MDTIYKAIEFKISGHNLEQALQGWSLHSYRNVYTRYNITDVSYLFVYNGGRSL